MLKMAIRQERPGRAGRANAKETGLKRTPNSVDVHVGSRVRMRRMAVGLTQDKLARALGLTFQQVQKYEKGSNRIGAGRLQAISRILDAPLSYFYAEGPGALSARLQEAQNASSARKPPTAPESLELVKRFLAVHDADARRSLIGLVAALGEKSARRES